jgi:hypothetical protein
MDWFWRLLGRERTRGPSKIRRVIVLVIDGLEPALVDEYLDEGLLHHLALLSDIGGRAPLLDSGAEARAVCGSLRHAISRLGVQAVELPPVEPSPPADLAAICAADRQQQERLLAALARSRPAVVIGVFDMPARLKRLFGSRPDESQRLVLRDVHARMDEIVGKAFSFVDERTALLAVVSGKNPGDVTPPSAPVALLFSSRKLSDSFAAEINLESAIASLLRPKARDS